MSNDQPPHPSSSSFLGHRRNASSGNPPDAVSIPPQSVPSMSWTNNGLTPAFELHDDPLASGSTSNSHSTTHRHRLPHQHQLSTSVNLPDIVEQETIKLKRDDSGSKRGRAAPAPTTGRTSGREDLESRQSIGKKAHQSLSGLSRDEQQDPSLSPLHISADRGHTTHSRVNSPSIDIHRRAWTPTPAITSPSQHQPDLHYSLPARQGSIQRKAAEISLRSPGARASPALFKSPSRPGHQESYSGESLPRRYEDHPDDEAGKGHGRRVSSPHLRRKSSVGTRPMVKGSSGEARSASRVRRAADEGRMTPAQYRPEKKTPVKSNSTPVESSNQELGEERSSSSSYVAMDRQSGSTSPLVVPQARRGAINLRTKRSNRRRCGTKRVRESKRPFWETVTIFVQRTLWHLAHPFVTMKLGKDWLWQTAYDTDKAFRCPITGQRVWWPEWIEAYIPFLIWLVISLGSTITVLTFHSQVFKGLDDLSKTLQRLGTGGKMIIGGLIFLTTFPPLPLYSTLIILCGFSFGLWQGFIISYIAALSGAVVVFMMSKSLLRHWMDGLLSKSGSLKKVVRAIEKRPKLLFLIRLAPYPYNLMNTLLASSPTLTFKTYFLCTALALPKLLVHCGLGASIKNFAAYHGASNDASEDGGAGQTNKTGPAETAKRIAGFVGIALCIGIFIYLLSVARKAVDEEVDSDAEGEEYDVLGTDEDSSGQEESLSEDEDEAQLLPLTQVSYYNDRSGDGESDGEKGHTLSIRTKDLDDRSSIKLQSAPGRTRSRNFDTTTSSTTSGPTGGAGAGAGATAPTYEVPADAVAFRIASPDSLEMSSVYTTSASPAFDLRGLHGRFGAGDQPYRQNSGGGAKSPFDLLGSSRGQTIRPDEDKGNEDQFERDVDRDRDRDGDRDRFKIDFLEEEAERSFASTTTSTTTTSTTTAAAPAPSSSSKN